MRVGKYTIELFSKDAETAIEVSGFLRDNQFVPEDSLERVLGFVLYVLRDELDDVAGVNIIPPGQVSQLGDHTFFLYRNFLHQDVTDVEAIRAMMKMSWKYLQEQYDDAGPAAPKGMYLEIHHPLVLAEDKLGRWEGDAFVFVGKTEKGGNKRVCYFEEARI